MSIKNYIIMIAILILICIGTNYYDNHHGYEYIDFNNKRAISSKCYANDEGLFCKTNGGLVDVKQFGKR